MNNSDAQDDLATGAGLLTPRAAVCGVNGQTILEQYLRWELGCIAAFVILGYWDAVASSESEILRQKSWNGFTDGPGASLPQCSGCWYKLNSTAIRCFCCCCTWQVALHRQRPQTILPRPGQIVQIRLRIHHGTPQRIERGLDCFSCCCGA